MDIRIKTAVTLLAALAGGWCGKKLRIPAGAMVGAIAASAILNITTGAAYVPAAAKPVLQIAGGILLGHTIGRESLLLMKRIGRAVIILILGLIVLNITLSGIIHSLCKMDLTTALFATAPGGVSDMALIAEEFGADTGVISVIQLFRMFGIYLIYPPLLKRIAAYTSVRGEGPGENNEQELKTEIAGKQAGNILLTILSGVAGGLLLKNTGLPAGALIGSAAACSLWNIVTGRGMISAKVRFPIQAGVGSLIGAQMTFQSVISLKDLAWPIVIMLTGMIVYTFLFAFWMHKSSGMDFTTCLLALTPGGIQETSLLAQDLGGNMAVVIVMHTVRLVAVICIFPVLLTLFM